MNRTELQAWLIDLPGFRDRLLQVTKASVVGQFDSVYETIPRPSESDLRYLFLAASLLSTSECERAQDAALRIAQYGVLVSEKPEMKATAAFILDQLGNVPAMRLGMHRGVIPEDFVDRLSGKLLYEHWQRQLDLTVETVAGEQLQLNRFQKSVWDEARQADWLSVSAPTSSGKSFVIKKLIENEAQLLGTGVAVYLVPTRALIQEVESDFIHYFSDRNGHAGAVVSSMPVAGALRTDRFNVLVLTQERYHLLQTAKPDLEIALLVVDEAQKMSDRQRGVLLQQVVDRTAETNPQAKVLFASPHTSNPEAVLTGAPKGVRARSLSASQVTVNQNLIWALQKPRKPTEWEFHLISDGTPHHIADFHLPDTPQPESKRLPFVSLALGSGGGNLVYVNSAAGAEKTATQIYAMLPHDELSKAELKQVTPLMDLVRRTVHGSYALARVLKRGVAFHYGNMPHLMRCEIERLFRDGIIRYLVCTSTLLEGVNLPCRSIFVRGPQSGRGNPMTPGDFWNLAGRAGRWGSEFQGNIICVDARRTDLWPNQPHERVRMRIEPATTSILNRVEDFVQWAGDGSLSDTKAPSEYPQILNYLVSEYCRKGSIDALHWLSEIDDVARASLQDSIEAVVMSLGIPDEIVRRNPGIDPRLMARMIPLLQKCEDAELVNLLPPDPASEDAVEGFVKILALIDRAFGPIFGPSSNREWQLALLITQWLRGHSLARLIAKRISAYERKGRTVRLPAMIREVMSDVETYARFNAPKYLACYTDLLKFFLSNSGRNELAGSVVDFGLFLEFGVSEDTQLSLISLGLSRTSVVALFELMPVSSWTSEECMKWLRDQDIWSLDIPILVQREIIEKYPELDNTATPGGSHSEGQI